MAIEMADPWWEPSLFGWPLWAVLCLSVLSVVCIAVQWLDVPEKAAADQTTPKFRSFQRNYLAIYLIIFLADWLQGTNMYTLYMSYDVDIGTLFLTGFATSGVCSMVVGPYIDKYGRKRACIVYCVLEVVINLLEHFNNFPLLMVGRVMGGLSTALLFTALESWMVTEHRKQGHPEALLGQTFSRAATGNGLVAVFAGVLAQVCADAYGEIGPFRAAIALTVVALVAICYSWDENYGEQQEDTKSAKKKDTALQVILGDRRVLLIGLVQSLFEGAMYTFVFNWVPMMMGLMPKGQSFSSVQGLIFSCFMLAMAIGGSMLGPLRRIATVPQFSVGVIMVAAVSMYVPVAAPSLYPVMASFLVMEACVGLFMACGGTMRSMVVPEEMSASVMNLFRVPLNVLVVIGTKLDSYATPSTVFTVIFVWLLLASFLQIAFSASIGKTSKGAKAN